MNSNHCPLGIVSSRIYTYKITFKDVPYYYYGVHKEKRFNDDYMGSPSTNKWCWDLYEAERQILEVFPNTDEGWIDALNVEKRLIRPVYNSDPYCLNESCGGVVSLSSARKVGKENYKNKTACFVLSTEERKQIGLKVGKSHYEKGIGFFSYTKDERVKLSKQTYKKGKGIGGLTKEQLSENGKKGISQKWKCLVTGKITNAGALTIYQRAKGIDTSKRVRIG